MKRTTAMIVLGLLLGLNPVTLKGQPAREAPKDIRSLQDAVSMALAHDPGLREAMARVDAASGALQQVRSARFPVLTSDASLARYQEPWLVAPLHGFDPTQAPEFDRTLVRANVLFSYSVFDGGARTSRIRGAESGRGQAAFGQESARMDLLASVAAAYLDLLAAVDLLEAAAIQREALSAEEARVQQFLAEGKAARVDLLRVQAALSQARASEISLESGLEVARGRLSRLTGVPDAEIRPGDLAPVRMAQGSPSPSWTDALDRARSGSPELRAAELRVVGAEAGVREARADWLPKLEAAGGYTDYGSLQGSHTWEWQGSLRVSFPLFTGGARNGALEKARAEERGAREALRRNELAIEQSVQEAVSAVVEARARREALERGVDQTAEVARIEALALDVGSGVQTDFLRAQADLYRARAALVQARHGEVLASLSLARISGELSERWIEDNMEESR